MHQYKLHFLVIFLFTSFPIKAIEKHNLNIFFEFPVKNTYEIEFIEDVKLIKIQDIKEYLDSQNWVETYFFKRFLLGDSYLVIRQYQPISKWNNSFFINNDGKKFLIDESATLPNIDCDESKLNDGITLLRLLSPLINKASKEISLISFEYGVGWLITTDGYQKIRFSEKLSENKISDFEILYTYLLENNKNPSIIDMRNKSGAALRYDKK